MARARNIKPGIMENEDLAELEPIARLLFVYLWMLADRDGRLEDRPKRIKVKALPYDSEANVDELLDELQSSGFIVRYEADRTRCIQIVNFLKHQKPHSNESASVLPPCPEELLTMVQSSCDQGDDGEFPGFEGLGPCISDSLIPDSLIACEKKEANASVDSGAKAAPTDDLLTEREGNGSTGERVSEGIPTCPVQQIVSLYHAAMPENPKVRVLDDARRKAIGARWRQASKLHGVGPFGYSTGADGLAAWKAFFEVCADSDFLTGKSQPRPGKPPFVADIDFLMSPSGFKKTLENKYHREVKE